MSNVIVINPFEVPDDRLDEALEAWDRIAAFMERQDGFVSARLHQTADPRSQFSLVTVAEWESAEHFSSAPGSDELRALDRDMAEFPHQPGIYRIVRG
jgi:heme oxygenase (mycobilin-producing)